MRIETVLGILLARYVDKHGANPLNIALSDLPDDVKGEVHALIKRYPVDFDISTLGSESEESEAERYKLRGTDYYMADREPIAYIVDSLIPEGSVNLWYGHFGSKKTWSLLNLAVCVASGNDWLDFKVNPCKVLIIDEESGERRLGDRIKSIIRGEGTDEDIPLVSVSLAQFNLRNSPDDLTSLISLITLTGAKLVIIDALADIMLGGDENSVKDTQPVFAGLRKASEVTGASFIVIHHSNKLGGYRGSSAIAGAIDNMVLIESKPESDVITFKTEKVRDGVPMNFAGLARWREEGFSMSPSEYIAGFTITKAQQFTLDYFEDKGNSTLAELVDHAGGLYALETLKKSVQVLINRGLLERKNEGGKRIEAIYGVRNNDKS